jgi:hypothetical protein
MLELIASKHLWYIAAAYSIGVGMLLLATVGVVRQRLKLRALLNSINEVEIHGK